MRKRLGYLRVIALLAAAAGALLLYTPLGERPLTALFPVGEVAPVDFAALTPGDSPNRHLVCPPDFCAAAQPQAFSPVFEIPAADLRARWQAVVAARPRVRLLAESADGLQFDYVARTARFRFPDIVTVRFVALGPAQSTLAVYSRSIYGRSDLGANRARVESWLAALRQRP